MTALLSDDLEKITTGKYLFLDTDFLNELYHDKELFTQFTELVYGKAYPIIDSLIEFEFTRSVTYAAELEQRRKFIKNELFKPTPNNQEIFLRIQSNAMILSEIYALRNDGNNASMVDLFLAARVMINDPDIALIITSNTKDYPSCVFSLVGTITKRQKGSQIQSFGILKFLPENFRNSYEQLNESGII